MSVSTLETKNNRMMCGGFVVLCNKNEVMNVLLVSTHKGVWGYPKGKRNKNEPLLTCAFRELEEETGLKKEKLHIFDTDTIFFNELTKNNVASVRLYLATTSDLVTPKIYDVDELAEAKWVKIADACNLLTRKNRKQILLDAVKSYTDTI